MRCWPLQARRLLDSRVRGGCVAGRAEGAQLTLRCCRHVACRYLFFETQREQAARDHVANKEDAQVSQGAISSAWGLVLLL